MQLNLVQTVVFVGGNMARIALLAGGGAAVTAAAGMGAMVMMRDAPAPAPDPAPQEAAQEVAQPTETLAPEADVASQLQAATVPETEVAPEPAPEPEVAVAEPEVAPVSEPAAEPDKPVVAAPSIDVVRVEPNGQTLLAGRGMAEREILVLLDGDQISDVVTDGAGQFVSFLDIPPSEKPRVLTVAMMMDGTRVPGDGSIIITPVRPTVLAEAEPEAETKIESAPEEGDEQISEPAAPTTQVAQVPLPTPSAPDPQPQVPEAEATLSTSEPEPAPEVDVADTPSTEPDVTEHDVAEMAHATETEPETTDQVAETDSTAPNTSAQAAGSAAEPRATEEVAQVPAPELESAEEPAEAAAAEPDTPAEQVAPTVLATNEEGLRVLQAPQVSESIALDTISYDDGGDVQLAGRALDGFVRVYIDNTPITTTPIRPDGSWRVGLPEVDQGIYTLRVDEVDPDGIVTSRVETPFKREDRETLANEDEGGHSEARVLTVQPGNTLWAIARERYGEGTLYVRLFEANRDQIRDPDLIYPGQVFDIPE
ncbi:MAG: LysM peptidoglycan-binding domain-containing protein [Marinovum sp.]|nr:LysM peptidoglycan-binding domain-containing protein [Marinovum sp.]